MRRTERTHGSRNSTSDRRATPEGPVQLLRWMLAALLLVLAAACDDGAPTTGLDVDVWLGDSGDLGDVTRPEGCDQIAEVTLVRKRSVAGGQQLHILLADSDGVALEGELAACFEVTLEGGGAIAAATSAEAPAAQAVLVVVGADAVEDEATLLFVSELTRRLSEEATVALWVMGAGLRQVQTATRDEQQLGRGLHRLAHAAGPAPTDTDIRILSVEAAEEWSRYDRHSLLGQRAVVFVHPSMNSAPPIDPAVGETRNYWILAGAGARPGRHFMFDSADPGGLAADVAAAVSRDANRTLGVIGVCDGALGADLRLQTDSGFVAALSIGDGAVEHRVDSCALFETVRTERPPAAVVDLHFTPEEREVYESRRSEASKEDFSAGWELDEDGSIAPSASHFRGQSSMACERRNFSVNLAENDPRYVTPATGSDEFFLISMCLDDRYVNQLTAFDLLRQQHASLLETAVLELRLDAESRGVYMYIDDPGDVLPRRISRARAVIRRDTDIDGKVAEVKWAEDDAREDALARYEAWVAEVRALSGADVAGQLRSRFDLDVYLRWIALMSLLQNGDYVDEVYFVESETVDAEGRTSNFFSMQAWDPDDLFSDCHHDRRFAIDDEWGLLYCSEGLIDHAMFAHNEVYGLYVDTLEELLLWLSEDRFAEVLGAVGATIGDWLQVDDVRAAMVELLDANPAASDALVARGEIDAKVAEMQEAYAERRALLTARIAAWRAAN